MRADKPLTIHENCERIDPRPTKETTMDNQALNKICFTTCIICIIIGVVLSLALVYDGTHQMIFSGGVCLYSNPTAPPSPLNAPIGAFFSWVMTEQGEKKTKQLSFP